MLPTAKDAGTTASVRPSDVPSSNQSVTCVWSGVDGSAAAERVTPGDTSRLVTSLPACASGPKRPAARAWKSPALKGISTWKLTHSTDAVDWPVESRSEERRVGKEC